VAGLVLLALLWGYTTAGRRLRNLEQSAGQRAEDTRRQASTEGVVGERLARLETGLESNFNGFARRIDDVVASLRDLTTRLQPTVDVVERLEGITARLDTMVKLMHGKDATLAATEADPADPDPGSRVQPGENSIPSALPVTGTVTGPLTAAVEPPPPESSTAGSPPSSARG
jgi:hypothetical protein